MKENIVEFPDRGVVQEEAALWLIRLDGDAEPGADTLADMRAWMARSPVHGDELRSLAATWKRMNVLTELSVPLGKVDTRRREGAGMLQGLRRLVPGRAALLSLVFMVALASTYPLWKPDALLASNGRYSTQVGEQSTALLADGSVVLLNTNSEIEVEYHEGFRDIRLVRGEVEFTVAKNADVPFRVHVGNQLVQALGTAFTVYMQESKVDVTVTEGRVALAAIGQLLPPIPSAQEPPQGGSAGPAPRSYVKDYVETLGTLRAGQSATLSTVVDAAASQLSAIESIETVEDQDMARRLSWRDGLLIFAGDPLEDVVREISRYTTVAIEISDPAVRAIKIGGQFPVGETEAMLDVLESNFGLRVTRLSEDRILLSAAEN